MGGLLTYGNRKFEALDSKMREIIPPLHEVSRDLVPRVDADSLAFHQLMVSLSPSKRPVGHVIFCPQHVSVMSISAITVTCVYM